MSLISDPPRRAAESSESLAPEPLVGGDPFGDFVEPLGLQGVEALASNNGVGDNAGIFENSEVLRDGRTADVEGVGDVVHRPLAIREQLDDASARRIGDGSVDVDGGFAPGPSDASSHR
jgi:hypothetical protein